MKNKQELLVNKTNETTNFTLQEIGSEGLIPENIPAQKIIFKDQKSWETFWKKYGKGSAPQIDFTKYMVIGVFCGVKPNTGYKVEITQIQKLKSQIVVKITEYVENPNYTYLTIVIYPYHIVFFPKTEGEIVFDVEQKIREEE